MQRPGANLNNMKVEDFLCDFCRTAWDGAFPMVEGHHGSLVCGACLSRAYKEVVLCSSSDDPMTGPCTMCLGERRERGWQSPDAPDARLCARCINQSAAALEKDPDAGWERPASGSGGAHHG